MLFELNADFQELGADPLYGLNFLDIAIMALVGITFVGLLQILGRISKILLTIAGVLPFVGIVLFVVTRMAGRSGVMGAGLIVSFVMLRSGSFSKAAATMGILANDLLLGGDLGTAISRSPVIAVLVGVGYVLLMIWFFLIGGRLLQLGRTPDLD